MMHALFIYIYIYTYIFIYICIGISVRVFFIPPCIPPAAATELSRRSPAVHRNARKARQRARARLSGPAPSAGDAAQASLDGKAQQPLVAHHSFIDHPDIMPRRNFGQAMQLAHMGCTTGSPFMNVGGSNPFAFQVVQRGKKQNSRYTVCGTFGCRNWWYDHKFTGACKECGTVSGGKNRAKATPAAAPPSPAQDPPSTLSPEQLEVLRKVLDDSAAATGVSTQFVIDLIGPGGNTSAADQSHQTEPAKETDAWKVLQNARSAANRARQAHDKALTATDAARSQLEKARQFEQGKQQEAANADAALAAAQSDYLVLSGKNAAGPAQAPASVALLDQAAKLEATVTELRAKAAEQRQVEIEKEAGRGAKRDTADTQIDPTGPEETMGEPVVPRVPDGPKSTKAARTEASAAAKAAATKPMPPRG